MKSEIKDDSITGGKNYYIGTKTKRPKLRKDFHSVIKQLREKKGLSRESVAEAAGIHLKSYIRYEKGEIKKPQINALVAMANYLDVQLGVFYEK